MLSISHLSKSFGTKKVLKDISLHVRRGEIALLLGASGSGKSTLLRILNNLETKDTGTITLDGKELDLTQINRNHLIGMVFQQFNLFEHMTVLENITFPLERGLNKSHAEAVHEAQILLDHYNLVDKAHEYVTQLSGGQKQRLALARTLALKPTVICLDEPTSALDPLLTSYVADSIQKLADEGYIVLVASHDTKLIERLTCTIYLIEEGQITESAASSEYHALPKTFSKIDSFIKGQANPL
jgi:ABC-type polar amino acid transport system ATPase subunit